MEKLLETITKHREKRGWSEYLLAERSGLPQSTISSWYCKNAIPSLASLQKIGTAFGITLSQLLAGEDEPVSLTDSQRRLLEAWDTLTEEQQTAVFQLIKNM